MNGYIEVIKYRARRRLGSENRDHRDRHPTSLGSLLQSHESLLKKGARTINGGIRWRRVSVPSQSNKESGIRGRSELTEQRRIPLEESRQ